MMALCAVLAFTSTSLLCIFLMFFHERMFALFLQGSRRKKCSREFQAPILLHQADTPRSWNTKRSGWRHSMRRLWWLQLLQGTGWGHAGFPIRHTPSCRFQRWVGKAIANKGRELRWVRVSTPPGREGTAKFPKVISGNNIGSGDGQPQSL